MSIHTPLDIFRAVQNAIAKSLSLSDEEKEAITLETTLPDLLTETGDILDITHRIRKNIGARFTSDAIFGNEVSGTVRSLCQTIAPLVNVTWEDPAELLVAQV